VNVNADPGLKRLQKQAKQMQQGQLPTARLGLQSGAYFGSSPRLLHSPVTRSCGSGAAGPRPSCSTTTTIPAPLWPLASRIVLRRASMRVQLVGSPSTSELCVCVRRR